MQTPVTAGRRQNPQAERLRHTLSIAPARQTGKQVQRFSLDGVIAQLEVEASKGTL